MLLVYAIPFEWMTPRLRRLRGQNVRVRLRPLRDDVCPHLGRTDAVPKDMEE